MKIKIKDDPVTKVKFGDFILACMRIVDASEKIAKEVNEMTKKPCDICGEVDEVFKCDSCGKKVCQDHITRQMSAEDDFIDLCTSCLEKD